MFEDDRVRLECRQCCYAVTGIAPWKTADKHEAETGHTMREIYDDE